MSTPSRPTIPRAVQLVIDDVGRRMGIKARGPMYRRPPVIDRITTVEDYAAIASIGEACGMCPQTAMELCDWDRDNVCAKYPTTQWMGSAWDNSEVYGPWVEEVCQLYAERADHIELTMHGVGHDYWTDGEPHPGEWVNAETGEPWGNGQDHVDCFRAIMEQHDLHQRLPTPFPESFVACYFQYCLRDGDPTSTGALMVRNGVVYASNPFKPDWRTFDYPHAEDGVFDSGLLLLARDNMDVGHSEVATIPARLPRTSICGMHWGNMVDHDVANNDRGAARWIDYLKSIDKADGLMLARNTEQCWSQWVFHTYAELRQDGDHWLIDLSRVPDRAWDGGYVKTMTLEIPLDAGDHIASFESGAFRVVGYGERYGAARVELKPLSREGDPVSWTVGECCLDVGSE